MKMALISHRFKQRSMRTRSVADGPLKQVVRVGDVRQIYKHTARESGLFNIARRRNPVPKLIV